MPAHVWPCTGAASYEVTEWTPAAPYRVIPTLGSSLVLLAFLSKLQSQCTESVSFTSGKLVYFFSYALAARAFFTVSGAGIIGPNNMWLWSVGQAVGTTVVDRLQPARRVPCIAAGQWCRNVPLPVGFIHSAQPLILPLTVALHCT